MTIENIMFLLNAYGGFDYFIQVALFTAFIIVLTLPMVIIISILGIIRTLAEGFACLLSWGRVLPQEEEEGFIFPFLKKLFSGKKQKEKVEAK